MLPLLTLVTAFGCQNNTIVLEFETDGTPPPSNDDNNNDDADDTTGGDGPTTTDTPPVGELDLHLVLSTPYEPSLPFQGIISGTLNTSDTLDLTLQWVSLDPGSLTRPRIPVGDIYAYSGIPAGPDGSFVLETGVILIPGAANPVDQQDLVVSLVIVADTFGNPTFCGAAGGAITAPFEFPLDGATHSLNVVSDPGALPADFPLGCP